MTNPFPRLPATNAQTHVQYRMKPGHITRITRTLDLIHDSPFNTLNITHDNQTTHKTPKRKTQPKI
jgi:hypothetical protein